MSLTKSQRAALPDSDFAVPSTRTLPIHDEIHARMAWKMVDQIPSLDGTQRKEARQLILAKAKDLGINTDDWHTIEAMSLSLEAMSLDVPRIDDHPNRVPFAGVLTKLDEPSDLPPGGSGGRRVVMSSASAQEALPSLLGMAVDFTEGLDGHDTRAKIGVITGANIIGNEIHIEGFFYAADFPEEVQRIQAAKSKLGWSYEIQRVRIVDPSADPLEIESFVFTGAAVLQKSKAAYQTTSLTASAEKDQIMDEQLKALLASMEALTQKVGAMEEKIAAAAGSPVHTAVKEHADKLRACADGMAAAGIGAHPTAGHAAVLKRIADDMEADAVRGILPQSFHGYYASAEKPKTEDKDVADLKASIAELTKQIGTLASDASAAKIAAAAAPERKTLPAHTSALLAKAGVTVDGASKLSVADIDKAFQAAGISSQNSMAAKIQMQRAGLLG